MDGQSAQLPVPDDSGANGTTVGPVPEPRLVDWEMVFTGIILPAICFAISFPEQPDWQSGEYAAYAQLLLSHLPSLPLYPLLLYCMTCLALLLWQPGRYSEQALVRIGIYSGVLMAAEYCVAFECSLGFAKDVIFWQSVATAMAGSLVFGIRRSLPYLRRKSGFATIACVVAFVLGVCAFPYLAIGSLFCAPLWALATYSIVSVRLIGRFVQWPLRFQLWQLFGGVSWLAAHLAAWRLAFVLMLAEYARLPTTQPTRCFVCTAAANGYPRVVRSAAYHAPGGAICRVNRQLRNLKAFELLLICGTPGLHRKCRRLYDTIGPLVAAGLRHPLLASAAYFALKPAELLAVLCLTIALGGDLAPVRRIYRDADDAVHEGEN